MASATHTRHADSGKFLRNATEFDRPGQKPTSRDKEQSATIASEGSISIARKYADLRSISDAKAAATRKWKRFLVLAVRIDSPADTNTDKNFTTTLTRLFQEAEKEKGAFWFPWQDALYGCVLPETDPAAALDFASRLQAGLAGSRPETVTIGIAQFPLIAFNRPQIFVNACKALDHAAFFGPGGRALFDAISLNISGDQYYQENDLQGAIAEYGDALRLDAANSNVHNSMGVCLAKNNDLEAAAISFETALQFDPAEAMAVYNLGVIHLQKDNPLEALACFEKAYSLDAATFEIVIQIGKLHSDLGRWEEAEKYLQAAIALRCDSAAAFCLLGQCLTAVEKNTEAIQAYTKTVKLNPNDATALSALGELYAAKGENPEICLTFSQQSVALAPESGLFHYRLACLYQKYDQIDQALVEYEKAQALGHDSTIEFEQVRGLADTTAGNGEKQCCA